MEDLHKEEALVDKIANSTHGYDLSSSDSEDEKTMPPSIKANAYRLFGRQKSVHNALGGGKPADVLLWKDTKLSAVVLGGDTIIWFLFNVMEYPMLTLICHGLILVMSYLFLRSNVSSTFTRKPPPRIPEVIIPEDKVLQLASIFRVEINRAFAVARGIVVGRDVMKFLYVIAVLWILSHVGNWCDFLTLLYAIKVLLLTVPFFYDKYEHTVDSFAEKAISEFRKQYAEFDAVVLSKIPKGSLKDRKGD